MPAFGEGLRKEREKQGVTLDEICASTKIAVRFLQAIEDERFDQLPGGIFNKGFVRSYAQHLGIDEQTAVDDYMLAAGLVPPPAPAAVATEAGAPELKIAETRIVEAKPVEVHKPEIKKVEEKLLPEPKPAVVETRPAKVKNKHAARQKQIQEKKKAPKPAPALEAKPEATPADWFPWGKLAFVLLLIAFGFAMWGSFHNSSEGHTSQPAPKPAINQSIGMPETKPAQDENLESAQGTVRQMLTSPVELQAALRVPEPIASETFMVVVEAHEDAWVSIIADGKEVMKETMGAPAQKAIQAHRDVVIKAGNVGALDFVFNGRRLPVQGDYDEVKTLTFDSNGLRARIAKNPGL